MNRAEHLQWCKDRAIAYVENDDIPGAVASMASDLGKHPKTRGHPSTQLGMVLLMAGQMDTAEAAREFITGFN